MTSRSEIQLKERYSNNIFQLNRSGIKSFKTRIHSDSYIYRYLKCSLVDLNSRKILSSDPYTCKYQINKKAKIDVTHFDLTIWRRNSYGFFYKMNFKIEKIH